VTTCEPSFRRRGGIDETAVEDDLFLVMPDTQAIFHLNAVGSALWRLLAEPRTRSEAAAILSAAFPDVPPSQLNADIDRFFEHLRWGGLILPEPPSA